MGDSTSKMLKDGRQTYLSFGSVYCKALRKNVVFNRYGWNHIIYKSGGHRRNEQDIRRRLHILPSVVDVIKTATSVLTEEREVKKKNEVVTATFYELKQFVNNGRRSLVTVVIREFEGLEPHFYSLRGRI